MLNTIVSEHRVYQLGDMLDQVKQFGLAENENLADVDFNLAKTLTTLVEARNLIDSIIKDASIGYRVANQEHA